MSVVAKRNTIGVAGASRMISSAASVARRGSPATEEERIAGTDGGTDGGREGP